MFTFRGTSFTKASSEAPYATMLVYEVPKCFPTTWVGMVVIFAGQNFYTRAS